MEPFTEVIRSALPALPEVKGSNTDTEVVCTQDPLEFWASLLSSIENDRAVALFDPAWPAEWRRQLTEFLENSPVPQGPAILIPTSGSSGLPKFCIHDPATLSSAAEGYRQRFGTRGLRHAIVMLPPHHVGGLMPVIRAAACGGHVHFANYRDPASFARPGFDLGEASLSLVPTQLSRMLGNSRSSERLSQLGQILVGGAGCPESLLERCYNLGLRLSPCYGMTETAAMVTVLDPEDFLAGNRSVGTALPHAQVEVDDQDRILVRSSACLRGYLPEKPGFHRDPFATGDVGAIGPRGDVTVLGRFDRVIITGGEKVHPELVEAAILATGLVDRVHCAGVSDPDWGTSVEVTITAPGANRDLIVRLKAALRDRLPPYAIPREFRIVDHLSGGKLSF